MARLIAPLNERSADYARASRRTGGLSENFSPSANEKAERLAAATTATDALRLLTHTADEVKRVTLPTLATAGDVREVVQYLKKKPTGVSVVEALDDVKRRVFEPRKVAAYEFWGIVARHGDRLLLTPLGWDFARKLEPGTEAYRVVLDGTPLYRLALEWIYRQNLDLVTHGDVASYWYEHHGALLDPANDKTMEGHVVCFFHLCQAAELGTVTIGKRGQPARLRVERDELAVYVGRDSERRVAVVAAAATTTTTAARPCFPPQFSGAGEAGRREARASEVAATAAAAGAEMRAAPWGSTNEPSARLRLFISCGSQNPKVVSQIQTTLELADIESHVVERVGADASALPVTDSAFEALRRCDAGLILLTKDDCLADTDGHFTLRQSVLIEVGAAFVLYDRRVVLLLDDELTLPGNLSALPHFTFGPDDLTWDAGIKLLKAIKSFSSGGRQITL